MNREDIIRMALEANIKQAIETPHLLMVHELERFAALVAAAARAEENEACAKLCDGMDHDGVMIAADCASAIRARSEK